MSDARIRVVLSLEEEKFMRGKTRLMIVSAIAPLALMAAACGGGGGNTSPGTEQSGGAAGGEITVAGCTPKTALVPGNTSEACGGDMISAMSAGLVHYNTDNAAPEMDIAQSIDTSDNKLFTVKLKPYKFQDGTEVKAKNFVDAWNYTAYAPNGQAGSYFMAPIAGYGDTQFPGGDAKKTPKSKTMSGLKVVDDKTFTIRTAEPVSNLLVRLGY